MRKYDILYSFFIVLVLLFYSPVLIDPVLGPRYFLLSFFCFCLSINFLTIANSSGSKMDWKILKMPVFFLISLWVIWELVSLSQCLVVSEGLVSVSKRIVCIVFLCFTLALIQNKLLSKEILIKSIVVASGIVVLVVLFQLIKLSLSREGLWSQLHEVNGLSANKNLLSSFLFLCLPFQILCFRYGKAWNNFAVILGVLGFLICWLVQTRATLIGYSLFALIYVAGNRLNFNLGTIDKNSRLRIGATIILLAIPVFLSILFKEKMSRLYNLESIQERIALWKNTVNLIGEHPWFGVGPGNWQFAYLKSGLNHFPVEKVRLGITTFQRPHNDFLWIASESGVPAVLFFIAVFGIVIYYGVQILIKYPNQSESRNILPLVACVVGYMAISGLDFPLERIEHQVLVVMLFVLIISTYYEIETRSILPFNTKKSRNVLLISLLLCTSAVFIGSYRISGEYHTKKVLAAHQKGNWNQLLKEGAKSKNIVYQVDPMSIPISWYEGVAHFSKGNTLEAHRSFLEAFALSPYNIHILNNLASTYEKQNQHAHSIQYYKQALYISKDMEESLLNLSAVYYNLRNYPEAYRIISKCKVQSKNPKYKVFLSAILSAYMEFTINKKCNSSEIKTKLSQKPDSESLVKLFFEERAKGNTFDFYLEKFISQ